MNIEKGDIVTINHLNIDKNEMYRVERLKLPKGMIKVQSVRTQRLINVHQDLVKVYLKRHDIIDTRDRIKNWLYN